MKTLLLNGTVGVGKTTALDAVGDELRRRGHPHALVDLDELRRIWPSPADDPFDQRLELRNLAAVAANAASAGAERLVLAGVLERASDRPAYLDAVGGDLTVVRLTLPLDTVLDRLEHRHGADADDLAWHRRRAPELAGILDAAGADDAVLDAAGLSPAQLAVRILDLWI